MEISLIPTVEYVKEEDVAGKTVVVIDVLRATSVISTALSNGAKEVITTTSVDGAVKLKDDMSLLGGERKALKIDGFDLSNSPLEYSRDIVEGKKIILTTTNGTVAINKSKNANNIYIGCMLNGRAVAKKIAEEDKDTVILCAGTYGKFSLDDFICAGKIIYETISINDAQLDDFSTAALCSYKDHKNDTLSYVKLASHYKYLLSIGLECDIKYCFKEDMIKCVPKYDSGKITIGEK